MDVSSWCSVQASQLYDGVPAECINAFFTCVAHTKADKCFDVLGKCVRSSASMKRAKTEDQTHACMVLRVKDPSCPLCDLFAKLFARSL